MVGLVEAAEAAEERRTAMARGWGGRPPGQLQRGHSVRAISSAREAAWEAVSREAKVLEEVARAEEFSDRLL